MAVAGVFAFAGAAQASLSDAAPELTAIQLANLKSLPGEPANPVEVVCHTSVINEEAALTIYCGICDYIPGKPGTAPMAKCYIEVEDPGGPEEPDPGIEV